MRGVATPHTRTLGWWLGWGGGLRWAEVLPWGRPECPEALLWGWLPHSAELGRLPASAWVSLRCLPVDFCRSSASARFEGLLLLVFSCSSHVWHEIPRCVALCVCGVGDKSTNDAFVGTLGWAAGLHCQCVGLACCSHVEEATLSARPAFCSSVCSLAQNKLLALQQNPKKKVCLCWEGNRDLVVICHRSWRARLGGTPSTQLCPCQGTLEETSSMLAG